MYSHNSKATQDIVLIFHGKGTSKCGNVDKVYQMDLNAKFKGRV